VLAGAAIPNTNGKKPGENAGEGENFVGGRLEHLEMFGVRLDEGAQITSVSQGQNRDEETGE